MISDFHQVTRPRQTPARILLTKAFLYKGNKYSFLHTFKYFQNGGDLRQRPGM
jgi:hypothetical protein